MEHPVLHYNAGTQMDSVRIAIIEDEVGAKEHLASCINDFFNSEGMPFLFSNPYATCFIFQ